MAFWKCESATIGDDKTSLELSFKDSHSCETTTIRLPVEEWKNILIYRMAYDEPERRLADAHRRLCRMLWDEARSLVKPTQPRSES